MITRLISFTAYVKLRFLLKVFPAVIGKKSVMKAWKRDNLLHPFQHYQHLITVICSGWKFNSGGNMYFTLLQLTLEIRCSTTIL